MRRFTTGHLIGAMGAWLALSTSLVAAIIISSGRPNSRAVILMGLGLVLLWCFGFGWFSRRYRDQIRQRVLSAPGSPGLKFVLGCTLLALLEEAVTVTMTNLAPLFGVPVGRAYITASANYLDVVCLHSVVVFVPLFVAWAWMLKRWQFSPNAVFLLFGLTGTFAEVSFGGPQHFAEIAMWTYVYGLMVYLPAYCMEPQASAQPPRWYHFVLTQLVPMPFVAPVAAVVSILHPVKIHFPPIVP